MKCLIADDAEHARELLSSILDDMGFELLLAADGEEAMRLALLSLPDLIILAIALQKMSGMEVAASLRRQPALKKTPIIALTANIGDHHPAHLQQAGFSTFLVKPVHPATLRSVVIAFTNC